VLRKKSAARPASKGEGENSQIETATKGRQVTTAVATEREEITFDVQRGQSNTMGGRGSSPSEVKKSRNREKARNRPTYDVEGKKREGR